MKKKEKEEIIVMQNGELINAEEYGYQVTIANNSVYGIDSATSKWGLLGKYKETISKEEVIKRYNRLIREREKGSE